MSIELEYLHGIIGTFTTYKDLAEKALAQVTDEQLVASLDDESNSIAVMVKHLAGNLRSRWTDFLTADGEKPDRNRDAEFEVSATATRAELMNAWEAGWRCALDTLRTLGPDDLSRTVLIRGEPHIVVNAIGRQLTHAAYHVGQIVFLAKHYAGESWHNLSVPRGKSQEHNAEMLPRSQGRGA